MKRRRNVKKQICLILSVLLAVLFSFTGMAQVYAAGEPKDDGPKAIDSEKAGTVQLDKTEGDVKVKNRSGRELTTREGMRLYSGNALETEAESYAYLALDDTKLVKLDEVSEAEVRRSGKKLEVLVESGKLFLDVTQPLEEEETLNIRTSTMVAGIRGTSGWVEVIDRWYSRLYILEGTVECSVTDPVTGQTKTATVTGGQTALLAVYPQDREGDKCDILMEGFDREDVDGFILKELAQDPPLCGKIYDASGIDVLPNLGRLFSIGQRLTDVGDELGQVRGGIYGGDPDEDAEETLALSKQELDHIKEELEEIREQETERHIQSAQEHLEQADEAMEDGDLHQAVDHLDEAKSDLMTVQKTEEAAAEESAAQKADERLQADEDETRRRLDELQEKLDAQEHNVAVDPVWEEPGEEEPKQPAAQENQEAAVEPSAEPVPETPPETAQETPQETAPEPTPEPDPTPQPRTFIMGTFTISELQEALNDTVNVSDVTVEPNEDPTKNTLVLSGENLSVPSGRLLTMNGSIPVNVESGSSLTVDGTMSDSGAVLTNNGTVTVNSSNTLIVSSIVNNGSLTNSSTGHITGDVTTNAGAVTSNAGVLEGACVQTGGTVQVTGGSAGAVTVTGGTFTVTGGSAGAVTVTGGTFTVAGGSAGAVTVSEGTFTLSGGTVGDVAMSGGSVNVAAGTAGAITAEGGSIAVTGGTAGSVTQNGGTVILSVGSGSILGGVTNAGGVLTVTVDGGTVSGQIHTSGGTSTVTVNGGTVDGGSGQAVLFDGTGSGSVALNGGELTSASDDCTVLREVISAMTGGIVTNTNAADTACAVRFNGAFDLDIQTMRDVVFRSRSSSIFMAADHTPIAPEFYMKNADGEGYNRFSENPLEKTFVMGEFSLEDVRSYLAHELCTGVVILPAGDATLNTWTVDSGLEIPASKSLTLSHDETNEVDMVISAGVTVTAEGPLLSIADVTVSGGTLAVNGRFEAERLNIYSGTVEEAAGGQIVVRDELTNNGTLTVRGNLSAPVTNNVQMILEEGAQIDGEIYSEEGNLEINGGTVERNIYFGAGTLKMTGGTVNGNINVESSDGEGREEISGGTVEGRVTLELGASLLLSGSAVINNGIDVDDSNLTITGGTVNYRTPASYQGAVVLGMGSYSVSITGGTINGGNYPAVYINGGSDAEAMVSGTADLRSDNRAVIVYRNTDSTDNGRINYFGSLIDCETYAPGTLQSDGSYRIDPADVGTVGDVLENTPDGGRMTLYQDIMIDGLNVNLTGDVILDLCGHNVKTSDANSMTLNGSGRLDIMGEGNFGNAGKAFTVTLNGSGGLSVSGGSYSQLTIENAGGGDVSLRGGTFTGLEDGERFEPAINYNGSGTEHVYLGSGAQVNGASLFINCHVQNDGASVNGTFSVDGGEFSMTGGVINGTVSVQDSDFSISDGEITSSGDYTISILSSGGHIYSLEGGTITNESADGRIFEMLMGGQWDDFKATAFSDAVGTVLRSKSGVFAKDDTGFPTPEGYEMRQDGDGYYYLTAVSGLSTSP